MNSRITAALRRDQRGITGLETAIILIAFVVVASVFAYTVLSAGIFSSEKGKEAVHSGLASARGSMELVGNVKATAVAATTLDTVDNVTSWTVSANVTAATDTADKKEGTAAADFTVAAGFTTGLVAYKAISSTDISTHYNGRLWIKSSVNIVAGELRLVIDETAACASPDETLQLPALTANTWTQPAMRMSTPSAMNAVICVGLQEPNDLGAHVLTVDLVEAPAEVTQVSFVVANALDGEPINLTTTTDADSDGIISDEATKSHVLTAIFSDKSHRVTDVTWTKTELGRGDGDNLLESGEKMLMTVYLYGGTPPVDSTAFRVTLAREKGADLVIDRTLPSVLDTTMDLR